MRDGVQEENGRELGLNIGIPKVANIRKTENEVPSMSEDENKAYSRAFDILKNGFPQLNSGKPLCPRVLHKVFLSN